ncbi:hypothetical protein [Rhizobium sp. BK661]|uniref:hypothetical protein n=1 Tax=Rhizobium sp. BK661 TaxID=2586991 RepID=UPI0021678C16|nr:hypothetical protein [Rhizobium sp. BK661]MCS3740234.1 hypothetical protein [Rhizobium sp. BK661]
MPNLERRIFEFHTGTVREIILATAIDDRIAREFLAHVDCAPLKAVATEVIPALISVCAGFIPQPRKSTSIAANSAPQPFSELYADLYEYATGWLGWTPDTAWNATPTEISRAYSAHVAKLKAIHGSDDGDSEKTDPRTEVAPEAVKEGIARLRQLARRR